MVKKRFRLRITGDLGFEVWQDIEGYEGLYQVSTYGRVKSLQKEVSNGAGHYIKKESLKKVSIRKDGYTQVKLSLNGEDKTFTLHRIIAETFLSNPHHYPSINHKDENPLNNRVENLEYCTVGYNNAYNDRYLRVAKKMGKTVQQIKDGVVLSTYYSCKQAARTLHLSATQITRCARGETSSYGGFEWKYV